MNTKQKHKCEYDVPYSSDGPIIRVCLESHGRFWVGDKKGGSQVNYCPFCGMKAPIQIILGLSALQQMPMPGQLSNLIKNTPPEYKVH